MANRIDATQAADIRNRENQLRQWMGKRNSYHPSELPADIIPPTNDERSALEIFEFMTNPPERYLLYIKRESQEATTWTGDTLGFVSFGAEYRSSFGDTRVPITVSAINGRVYHGTFYKSAGDYARVKVAKRKGQIVTHSGVAA